MRRLAIMQRLMAGAILAAAAAAAPAPVAAGSGNHEGWQWRVMTIIHCEEPTCGGSEILPPWMETLKNPFHATSDGHNGFYHSARLIAFGRPGHPRRCDETLFDRPFSGKCVVKDFGVGYIAPGAAIEGVRDFWVTSETARFGDGPRIDDPFAPYPIDTYQVAAPGHYGTDVVVGGEPDGVTGTMDVTRKHR